MKNDRKTAEVLADKALRKESPTPLDIASLLTADPESPFDLAMDLDTVKVELLTVEGSRGELEDAIVRTTMNLLRSEKVSARDKLGAIDRAADLTGLKQVAPTLINTGNMQLNQLSAGASRHLLSSGGALKTLSSAKSTSINIHREDIDDAETD